MAQRKRYHADENNKANEELAQQNFELSAQLSTAQEAMKAALKAIESLPSDALGHNAVDGYFYRDELAAQLRAAIGGEDDKTRV